MDVPTFFEIMTVLAFMHFADAKTDIAVIETGLGGRLDSTHVIMPKVILPWTMMGIRYIQKGINSWF